MKVLLAMVVALALPLFAAAEEKASILLHNGILLTPTGYKELRENTDRICQSVGKDAYRKYSDGSVMYLGKLLYMQHGVIPNVPPTNGVQLVSHGFKVLDVTPDGCRVRIYNAADQLEVNDLFITGFSVLRTEATRHH